MARSRPTSARAAPTPGTKTRVRPSSACVVWKIDDRRSAERRGPDSCQSTFGRSETREADALAFPSTLISSVARTSSPPG